MPLQALLMTFNMEPLHSYLVHGAGGRSHWIGFHFYFLTCFFIWRRGPWMIIRGNLIKGPGHFLGNLILVLILIFKAGNNECIVFLSIPKNKKTKKTYTPLSHINKVRNVHKNNWTGLDMPSVPGKEGTLPELDSTSIVS